MANYWANRRKKEAAKGKAIKISSKKEITFRVDDQHYLYVYQTTSNSGFAYIYKNAEKIYGPYAENITEEGRLVYKLLEEAKLI